MYQLYFSRVIMNMPASTEVFRAYIASAINHQINNPKTNFNVILAEIHEHIFTTGWMDAYRATLVPKAQKTNNEVNTNTNPNVNPFRSTASIMNRSI